MSSKNNPKPIPDLTTESAADLLERDLPPVKMVVGDIIPAGLLLLAGDPKAGKTLLLQHLALSIARGAQAWGCYPVEKGSVLYLAREGGDRFFRQRIEQMLDGEDAPTNLHIAYNSEPLGERLEFQLETWLLAHPDARLVVIDTYASVAPETRGVNRYQEDYNALGGLGDLARRFPDALLVLTHHTRKAEGEDVMHRINGSNQMTGATDANAVLLRHTAARRCILNIRPRNTGETEVVLERDETLCWYVVGDDELAQLSDGRRNIIKHLENVTEPVSPQELARALELTEANSRKYLSEMARAGQVVKVARGKYILAARGEDGSAA